MCWRQKLFLQTKFTNLSKIGFSLECFTVNFWQFYSKIIKSRFLGGRLGNCNEVEAFQGFS